MKLKSIEQQDIASQIFEESFNFENGFRLTKINQVYPAHLKQELTALNAAPLKKDHLSMTQKFASGLTSLIAIAFVFVFNLTVRKSKRDELMSHMWFS